VSDAVLLGDRLARDLVDRLLLDVAHATSMPALVAAVTSCDRNVNSIPLVKCRRMPLHWRSAKIRECRVRLTHVLFGEGRKAPVPRNHDDRQPDGYGPEPQNPGSIPTTEDERARDTYTPPDKLVGAVLNVIS
jgi:hypothetical protein